MTKKTMKAITAALIVAGLTSGAITVEAAEVFLKGDVTYQEASQLSLKKKLEKAADTFRRAGKGELFFTGYVFQSRHTLHWEDNQGRTGEFQVYSKGNDIKIRRPSLRHRGTTYRTEEGGEPAGLLLLHRTKGNSTSLVDVHILDLDNTYVFEEIPLYWVGEADTDQSVELLDEAFESGYHNELIFVISTHDSEKPYAFLKRVATGHYPSKARRDAIFWIGNYKDDRSLGLLKDIFADESSVEMKKQVIFAIYLSDDDKAIKEIIRVAKQDRSSQVRKQAIFWLGQKAGQESLKALKGFVEDDEDVEVKKQAVFAISQLPTDKAVPMLIDIAKSNKSMLVRKNAMFWLGQKDSEEALKFFENILIKK